MASEKGKQSVSPTNPASPIPEMDDLNINPSLPPRPKAPPRPSAASKPRVIPQPTPQMTQVDEDDESAEEDENDPFADRNALSTPQAEKTEPRW